MIIRTDVVKPQPFPKAKAFGVWSTRSGKKDQVISPTACGALFSARATPQQILVERSWNPGGTLVEPSWNLTSGPPRTTPQPIWAETQSFQLLGKNNKREARTSCAGPCGRSCALGSPGALGWVRIAQGSSGNWSKMGSQSHGLPFP